jgi:diaminopimelate decarboxylase
MQYEGPQLIFSLDRFARNARALMAEASSRGAHVLMAVKSCTLAPFLERAGELLDGFEISNLTELALLPPPAKPQRVMVTNPVLDSASAVLLGQRSPRPVTIHVDSVAQIGALAAAGRDVAVGVRLALDEDGLIDVDVDDGKAVRTRFGIPAGELGDALRAVRAGGHRLAGVHVHHYLVRTPASSFVRAAREVLAACQAAQFVPEYLDFGGGLAGVGVAGFGPLLRELRAIVPEQIDLIFEPGSLLFENAVMARGRVENIKTLKRTNLVFTDLSQVCHLNWSTPILLWPKHERQVVAHRVAVFGPTCFEGDVLGEYRIGSESAELPIRVGDVLSFGNILPYCQPWNRGFNGVAPATIVIQSSASSEGG